MSACKLSVAPNVKSVNKFLLTWVKIVENKPQLLGSYSHFCERQQSTVQIFSAIKRVTKENWEELKTENVVVVWGKNSS